MPLTSETASLQVQERLKALQGLIHDIDNERRRNETNYVNIVRIQDKYNGDEKSSSTIQTKIKHLYKTCLNDAAQEENLIRQSLTRIQEIRNIRNERRIQARNAGNKEAIRRGTLLKILKMTAQTLPLFVSKPGEKVPPLCGAMPADPTYLAKPGDMVAALVRIRKSELEIADNWILAEVVQYLPSQGKYEVDDIDEEQKERFQLSKRRIVPMPLMRANPETDVQALFPVDTMVLALYPQTTCLYKAIIHQLPATATDEYKVLFEDTDYDEGYSPPMDVPQRYVIAYKHVKKASSLSSN